MYLCKTVLFEIELFTYMKLDLALNNLQRLIYHKTQTVVYPRFTQFNERTNTLLYKNIYLSHFILERDVSVVSERWVETRTDCYIDPNSSLDHSTLCYLQEATYHFFRILAGVAQSGVAEGHNPQSASWPSLWPVPTNSTADGTCLYSFITPTCFRFFFRLFIPVNLWLTARSRVNIWQNNQLT